ncbi:MAG: peptide-methionine (S)-S-oxide reductase MsrA [Desulfuromusa sp.]|nr:peptide-methionine (S)-S-oxide reductase MsrA [Desulfuromusa sp.]
MKTKRIFILCVMLLSIATHAFAKTAVVAGGCFWCMESDFEKLEGVTDVISGFAGGTLEKPTYNGNHKGHYEAVEITYDPQKLSYKQLLDYYWVHIDPFDDGGQFCDRGHSYMAAIFIADDEEKKIAEESKVETQAMFPDQKIVTPILPATTFWPIHGEESYHQDYYKENPIRYNYYRWGCGRDQRVKEIWGDKATHK